MHITSCLHWCCMQDQSKVKWYLQDPTLQMEMSLMEQMPLQETTNSETGYGLASPAFKSISGCQPFCRMHASEVELQFCTPNCYLMYDVSTSMKCNAWAVYRAL